MNRKDIGQLGEDYALKRLTSSGYVLVERNFHNYYGELDLILRQGQTLVFIEVKTVSITAGYDPVEQMTPRKLVHLKNTINSYLSFKRISDQTIYRLDFVGLIVDNTNRIAKFDHRQSVG